MRINGIIPVMITPFTETGRIDEDGLANLVDWYVDRGADALFAVCLSSEMFFLDREERRHLASLVVKYAAGRVPVVVSGHVSDDVEGQVQDVRDAADSGADAVILLTNRLDEGAGGLVERAGILAASVPDDTPFGLYECPVPTRRLLKDDELKQLADSGRFVLLKDTSCDLQVVQRRLALVAGSPLTISNANAAIAWDAMQAGARGFCGIFANFCPDLYAWLLRHGDARPDLAADLAPVLALGAMCEAFGYPALAKLYHQRIGTFASTYTRSQQFDLRERFPGVEPLLDSIAAAIEGARARIAAT